MKTCIDCKIEKPLDEFNRHKDGHQSRCRSCDNAKNREWYAKNKQKALLRVARNNERYLQRGQDFVCDYLKNHPCVDCGESDIVVLEFDHVNGNKVNSIANLVKISGSIERLSDEIEKCEVVCANCHRRRTAKRGNFYKVRRFESSR